MMSNRNYTAHVNLFRLSTNKSALGSKETLKLEITESEITREDTLLKRDPKGTFLWSGKTGSEEDLGKQLSFLFRVERGPDSCWHQAD